MLAPIVYEKEICDGDHFINVRLDCFERNQKFLASTKFEVRRNDPGNEFEKGIFARYRHWGHKYLEVYTHHNTSSTTVTDLTKYGRPGNR